MDLATSLPSSQSWFVLPTPAPYEGHAPKGSCPLPLSTDGAEDRRTDNSVLLQWRLHLPCARSIAHRANDFAGPRSCATALALRHSASPIRQPNHHYRSLREPIRDRPSFLKKLIRSRRLHS